MYVTYFTFFFVLALAMYANLAATLIASNFIGSVCAAKVSGFIILVIKNPG